MSATVAILSILLVAPRKDVPSSVTLHQVQLKLVVVCMRRRSIRLTLTILRSRTVAAAAPQLHHLRRQVLRLQPSTLLKSPVHPLLPLPLLAKLRSLLRELLPVLVSQAVVLQPLHLWPR